MVSYTRASLPPLTEQDLASIKRGGPEQGRVIDTTDIPVWTEVQWKNAVRGGFYRPVKRQITARVDADVLAWLKAQGKGYQSRINAILRREMLAANNQGIK